MTIDNKPETEYDTLNPVEEIMRFNAFLRNAKSRYEGNERERIDVEKKLNDVLHLVELGDSLNARDGYKLYRKIRILRQKRRVLKKENELLYPVISFINENKKLTNDLNKLLGDCRGCKSRIDSRAYVTRTDILEEELGE